MALVTHYPQLFQATLTGGGTKDLVYTPAAGVEAIIKEIRMVNIHASTAATVRIYHGGNADGNTIMPDITVEAGCLLKDTGTITTDENDGLYFESDNASSIVVTGYGMEIS